ncbi:hypothetical protein FQ775_00150 [Nitratireductor mangrovi]|uniref:Peptidase C39 domain-containing protein n=1 Tax=Nitratireductor mangrovi TaxID=2599600 RepID=A0A5B8KTJ7_9HYPH|nr:peptidase C39 family protein [Nitratireductor mangrovi]QDY98911.1 hypothetical protein FQ775_00150 [Nitratireductor mangrovi]
MSQALPFLCGPAALITLLSWKGSIIANDLGNQIDLWRTANTVFMGQGPAGCDGAGLLRAADKHNQKLKLIRTKSDFSFARTVRSEVQKTVIRQVENDNLAFADALGRLITINEMKSAKQFLPDTPALLLCSMRAYSMSNEYHWITFKPGADMAIYDPLSGQYETKIDLRFFESFLHNGLHSTLSAYEKYIVDIIF